MTEENEQDLAGRDESEVLLNKYGASGVVVIIIGGKGGSGMFISTARPEFVSLVPEVLRQAAKEVEGEGVA